MPRSRRPQNSDINKDPIIPVRPQCLLCPWRGADLGAHFIEKHGTSEPKPKPKPAVKETPPMFNLSEYETRP